jgi:hypothetical protein
LYIPLSLWTMVALKTPELVAMLTMLPLYMLVVQFLVSLIGLYEFTGVHGLRPSRLSPLTLLVTYLPYQWLLCYAAFRAVARQLRGINVWEKTDHTGAHRRSLAPGESLPVVVEFVTRVPGPAAAPLDPAMVVVEPVTLPSEGALLEELADG